MTLETRFQVRRWFVETGWCDGNGIGLWERTQDSVPTNSQAEAEALRDEWLASGKLIKTHWGELRPNHDYGMFRIRSVWEDATPGASAASPEVQALIAVERGAWRDEPESSEAWCAGNQYMLDRLCVVVGADPATVQWDGSDGSLDEEADALIWRILRHNDDDDGLSPREKELIREAEARGCKVYAPKHGTDEGEALYHATRSGTTSAARSDDWMRLRDQMEARGLLSERYPHLNA